MNFFKRLFGHLRTVMKHRRMVRKLCFKCGLYWQGLTHDLSKYSITEFWRGVKHYTGTSSPHIGERKVSGYSAAWIHHHNCNKHHAEYWWDIKNGQASPIDIPYKYYVEMICDRVAASMIYLGDKYNDQAPYNYLKTHMDENRLHPSTKACLETDLLFIAECGFDCFAKQLKE